MPTPNLRCDLLAQRSMAGVAAGGIGVARPTQTPVVEEKRRDDRVVAHQAAPPASVGGAEEPRSPGESSAAAPRMRVQTAWEEREAWRLRRRQYRRLGSCHGRLVCLPRVQRFTNSDEPSGRANTLP